ncbi:hypothetical protein [Psychrobacillus sp. NPDC096389]
MPNVFVQGTSRYSKESGAVEPDYIADNPIDAVKWIVNDLNITNE